MAGNGRIRAAALNLTCALRPRRTAFQDLAPPERPVEIGWFDTTPYGESPPGFGGGTWTAWPFFESGMVVVSSMNEGLFILRPQRPVT